METKEQLEKSQSIFLYLLIRFSGSLLLPSFIGCCSCGFVYVTEFYLVSLHGSSPVQLKRLFT